MRTASFALTALAPLAAMLFSACASTSLINEWRSSSYNGPPFHKVVVFGVTKEAGLRRTFEDEFVAKLKAAGVDAVPSYQYIPQDGQAGDREIQQAVHDASAQAALTTRLVTAARKTQYASGVYPSAAFRFRRRCCVRVVGYYYTPYEYDVYVAETNLYDGVGNQLAWSGVTETTAPGKIRKEVQQFADLIIGVLRKQRLI